jgi:hypothetical protein
MLGKRASTSHWLRREKLAPSDGTARRPVDMQSSRLVAATPPASTHATVVTKRRIFNRTELFSPPSSEPIAALVDTIFRMDAERVAAAHGPSTKAAPAALRSCIGPSVG